MRVAIPPALPDWPLLRGALLVWRLPTNLIGHLLGLIATARRARRIGGARVSGWAYAIGWSRIGAITIGDVVLHDDGFFDGLSGRVLLAHELAHVVQHRVLGPLYLPAHAAAQCFSAWRSLGTRSDFVSLVHKDNPLEQRWICLSFDACSDVVAMPEAKRDHLLREFGV